MSKANQGRPYVSRRDRLKKHAQGWKMGILLALLALVIWMLLRIDDVLAYLKTFFY